MLCPTPLAPIASFKQLIIYAGKPIGSCQQAKNQENKTSGFYFRVRATSPAPPVYQRGTGLSTKFPGEFPEKICFPGVMSPSRMNANEKRGKIRRKFSQNPLLKLTTESGKEVEWGTLSFADLLSRYCTSVYAKLGSYQQTAEVLGLDRRTVRSKIDRELLKKLQKG